MYKLEIVLLGLPSTANSHKAHWAVAGAERKKWRQAACLVAKMRRPETPLERCRIVCTRYSFSEPDYDNLVISFKSLCDGLKDAGIIKDDKSSVVVQREYRWEKAPANKGKVMVYVEEVSE